jgi:hypothetical protein
MSGDQKFLEPIMSNSESIVQFEIMHTANQLLLLNILRNNYVELFDYALKCMRIVGNLAPNPEDFLEQWKMHLL